MWIIYYVMIFAFLTRMKLVAKLEHSGSCEVHAFDVVFAIDTSSSIWKPDFDRQLKFILDVCEQFDIGPGPKQTRVGVVSFADDYYLQFHLWQNNRKELLIRAVSRIRHKAGRKTAIGPALNFMLKTMFTRRCGSRESAAHVAIVITDGGSQDKKQTFLAAQAVQDSGIHIFAIGVGVGVDQFELEGIASKPSSKYMFTVENFRSLDAMKFVLANSTCKGSKTSHGEPTQIQKPPALHAPPKNYFQTTSEKTPTLIPRPVHMTTEADLKQFVRPTPKTISILPTGPGVEIQGDIGRHVNVKNCGGKPADIYFAIDSSNSIWPEDFKKQLVFVQDLINLFDISQQKTRVGLVTFSDSVLPIFDFNSKQEKSELMKQVSNIGFMSGRTNTGAALKFIHEQGFSQDLARREVAHIVLLITDGLSKSPHETAREAELAKRDGIYLFSIGIGQSLDQTEMMDIASDPDEDFVFFVSNFSVLNTIKNILAMKTCAVQPSDRATGENEIECSIKGPTDLVFVYDSSQIGIQKTRQITKFVYDVTDSLKMTSGHLKVSRLLENCLTGADTYLTGRKSAMDFDTINFPDFRGMIKKLASTGFSESYGARRHSKKVAVLFLDDGMENLKQAAEEIAGLKETHVLVLTIGDLDVFTAATFASRPTTDYLVHIPSYKYLATAKHTLVQKVCKTFAKEV